MAVCNGPCDMAPCPDDVRHTSVLLGGALAVGIPHPPAVSQAPSSCRLALTLSHPWVALAPLAHTHTHSWLAPPPCVQVTSLLEAGTISAYIFDKPALAYWSNTDDPSCVLTLLGGFIEPISYADAFSPGFPEV